MDAVTPASDDRTKEFGQALSGFNRAAEDLRDSAQLARLTEDPAAPSLEAMVRLMLAAARQFEVRERERKEIAASLDQRARRIAEDATHQIQASGTAIIERLAPELARLVDRSIRQRLWTVRLRTVLISAGVAVLVLLVAAGSSYVGGYKSGHANGLIESHIINSAIAAGPQAATAWAEIMAHNDPEPALEACMHSKAKDAFGRTFCALPIWLDPAGAPAAKKP